MCSIQEKPSRSLILNMLLTGIYHLKHFFHEFLNIFFTMIPVDLLPVIGIKSN